MKLVAVVAAIVVIPLLAAGGVALRQHALGETTTSASPLLTSPTPRTVTDERQARIAATTVPGPEVSAGAARGTITSVTVKRGEALADGAVLFQVDGIDRVAFASSMPFYRPISSGTQGADVAELQRLLVTKGMMAAMPAAPAVANFATGQAIGDLAESLGAARTTTFDPGWVVFLPAPGLIAETVDLEVGHQAPAQGAVIITTPGTVTSARLVSGNQEPLSFAPGVEYIVVLDGEEFAIDTLTQSIAAEDLPRVRAPKETERDGIPVLTKRKTPLQALAVPSSAVMTNDRGALCLWLPEGTNYRPITITLAGARGGVTNVASGLGASQEVLANPAQVLEAPECP